MRRYIIPLFFIVFCLIIGQACFALNSYDLAVFSGDIYLSKDDVYVGDNVRVYARIRNHGTEDVSTYVYFYQGNLLIGEPQYVSSVAGGEYEEVWVDNWVPTEGSYNIRVKIDKTLLVNNTSTGGKDEYIDQDVSNNEAISKLIYVCIDTDGDGICNVDDEDDDNDGLKDTQEDKNNNGDVDAGETDPLDPDTDDDGYIDSQDDCPLDPNGHLDSNNDGICGNEQEDSAGQSNDDSDNQDAEQDTNEDSNDNEALNEDQDSEDANNENETNEEDQQDREENDSEDLQQESSANETEEEQELPAILQKVKNNKLENMSLSTQFMDWWKLVNILVSMIVLLLIGAIALYYIGSKKKNNGKPDKNSKVKAEKNKEESKQETDEDFEEF